MSRLPWLAAFHALLVPLVLWSCGGGEGESGTPGGTSSSNAQSPPNAAPGGTWDETARGMLIVQSPPNSAVIDTSTVTVRVRGADWAELWVESRSLSSGPGLQTVRTDAHPFGSDSFAVGVPVWDGASRLDVKGRRAGEPLLTRTLQVTHSSPGVEGVRLSATPSTVHSPATPIQIESTYTGIGAPQEAWLDADGDGQLDASVPTTGVIPWTYPAEGYYLPRIVVRLANGMYHDSADQAVPVTVTSPPSLVDVPGQFELSVPARDVAVDRLNRQVLVLTQDSHLHVFDESGAPVASHTLQQVQDLVAIDVDDDGDVYAVDRALHQLRKFSRSSSFLPDASFGNAGVVGGLGTGSAQFDQPMDVQCLYAVGGVHVWVADSDNQRLQRFDGAGAFQLELPTGTGVDRPVSLVADFAGHVTVIDGTDGDLAVFEVGGTQVAYRPNALGVDPNHPLRAGADVDFGVIVADPANHALLRFDREGTVLATIGLAPSSPLAVVHATGNNVLVAVAGATRLQRLQFPEPVGESPIEVLTRFVTAIHQSADATALDLLAPETASELTSLLADPVKGPAYRDLAGRLSAASELSRSERTAAVHAMVDPGTPQAQPIVIELRRDAASNRWLVLGL